MGNKSGCRNACGNRNYIIFYPVGEFLRDFRLNIVTLLQNMLKYQLSEYQGNETYAFLMSDKYIMALYTHCLVARKEVAIQGKQIEGFTEKEYGMVRLEKVGDVLFQTLLLDDVKIELGKVYIHLNTIYIL